MEQLFSSSNSYPSLSLKDLLETRALFHYDILKKKNVVGTAVGLYRIRKGDPWPSKEHPHLKIPKGLYRKEPRTLFNSEVRPYSWPCIYAFVSSWEDEQELAQSNPADVVQPSYALPDGRSVPVCVIEAPLQPYAYDLKIDHNFTPRNVRGPGAALYTDGGQGMARLATASCIVRDGSRAYVLTNRHALGPAGSDVFTVGRNGLQLIGRSAAVGLDRLDFDAIYPNFISKRQRLLMDIGLVEVNNLLEWQTAIPGVDPMGDLVDLYDNALSLQLVGKKVVGQSAVSGFLRGEVHGLFYRYKALGGFEYISDFLIGPTSPTPYSETLDAAESEPRPVSFAPHHGDSGTLLLLEHETPNAKGEEEPPTKSYHPFAVLWGREEFFDGSSKQAYPFALATSLSTALDQLNLDFVRDLNADLPTIWGWVGHYMIGRRFPLAASLLHSSNLKKLIESNLESLAIDPALDLGNDPKAHDENGSPTFVALADVPDNVWKSNVNFISVDGTDGKSHRQRGPGARGHEENENHFADLDLDYEGKGLFLELNLRDPKTYLLPKVWLAYFASLQPQFTAWDQLLVSETGKPAYGTGGNHWGALPFRVHQLYDTMREATRQGDRTLFLVAGGVLIHYIGDACQPLHASYMSNGDPARVVTKSSGAKALEAEGVHSGYEDDMVAYGYQHGDLAGELDKQTNNDGLGIRTIANGYDASVAVIELIAQTRATLAPQAIIDKWMSLQALRSRQARAQAMWEAFGDATVICMARGTRLLAALWESAWANGNGEKNITDVTPVPQEDLMKQYLNPDVVPSVHLDNYPDDPDCNWSQLKRPVATQHRNSDRRVPSDS
ncbi:hypothetical protein [Massilia sp.]|uniref:hypothetical protein n=1 Tax=Massilia sp. TaxID=1882437 RepID=UPI00352FE76F